MKKEQLSILLLISAVTALLFAAMTAYLLGHLPWVWRTLAISGVVLLVAYVALERKSVASGLSKRTTQYGLNSILMSMIALAVVVVLNFIVAQHDIKKDYTKDKLHTLSDQSEKVLKGLKQEVRLRAFVGPNQIQEFDQILDKYTYVSKMVKKDYIDVDKEPLAVQKYGIKQQGTIIVETENRNARVDNLMGADDPKVEEKITNAIIAVAKGEKKKVYFVTGHGERLVSDSGREGLSEMKEALEASRFKVEELLLADKDKIPADAEVVVVAGPKSDFMEHELKMLDGYLKAGGKVLFMVEPTSSAGLKPFLAQYGVEWKPKKTVLETNRLQQLAGGNPLTPIVNAYSASHDITKEAKQMSIFPIPAPVEKAATVPSGYQVDSLFSTSTRSLEVEMSGDKVKVDEKKDRKGPISLALSISGKVKEEPKKAEDSGAKKEVGKETLQPPAEKSAEFRMVVVGDADFAANGVKRFGINSDLFQNMLSWLSKEEDLISIRPRATDSSQFEITEERFRIIHLASVWILPPMMFLSGLFMWLMRRRK